MTVTDVDEKLQGMPVDIKIARLDSREHAMVKDS